MTSLTEYGKFIQKYRIDKDISLKQMAADLNVSSAFLSKTERDETKLTISLLFAVIDKYSMSGSEIRSMFKAASSSMSCLRLKRADGFNDDHFELLMLFQFTWKTASHETRKKIWELIVG